MEKGKELPKRKKNRLENYDYSSCGAYFITICTIERRNYFWDSVGATIGRPQDVNLSQYGRIADEAINNISSIYPTLKVEHQVIMPDHIIRNRQDYEEHMKYIYENPTKWQYEIASTQNSKI